MNISNRSVIACATISSEAYSVDGDDDQGWAERAEARLIAKGFVDVSIWISGDAELIAATYDGCRIYAWRGSHSLADWIGNVHTLQIPFYDAGKIHSGFSYRFRSILNQDEGFGSLARDVQRNRTHGRPIICSGHSLGGAAATAMAAYEIHHGRGVQGLVTFGSPRVGNGEFAVALEAGIRLSGGKVLRFVNRCDPAVMLPSIWKYRHVSSPMFFSRDGSLKTKPSFGWMCLDRLLDAFQNRRSVRWDHAMSEYVDAINDKYR